MYKHYSSSRIITVFNKKITDLSLENIDDFEKFLSSSRGDSSTIFVFVSSFENELNL